MSWSRAKQRDQRGSGEKLSRGPRQGSRADETGGLETGAGAEQAGLQGEESGIRQGQEATSKYQVERLNMQMD